MATLRTTQSPRTRTRGGFSWSPRLCRPHHGLERFHSPKQKPRALGRHPSSPGPGHPPVGSASTQICPPGTCPRVRSASCVTGVSPRVMSRFAAAQRGWQVTAYRRSRNAGETPAWGRTMRWTQRGLRSGCRGWRCCGHARPHAGWTWASVSRAYPQVEVLGHVLFNF